MLSSSSRFNLLPGTYTFASAPGSLLPKLNTTTFEPIKAPLVSFSGAVEPFPESSSSQAEVWPLVIQGPEDVVYFKDPEFASDPQRLRPINSSEPGSTVKNDWSSLYLPPGVHLSFPKLVEQDERYRNIIFRSSVSQRNGMSNDMAGLELDLAQASWGSGECHSLRDVSFPC